MGEEAVDAGDSDVVEVLDAVAHEFGGDDGFFGDGDVAGAGRDDEDGAFALAFLGGRAIAMEGDATGKRAVFEKVGVGGVLALGEGGEDFVELFLGGARGEDVGFVLGEVDENVGDLPGRLALAENDFGHAVAESAVVVDVGEAEVLERKMAQALDGGIGGKLRARTSLKMRVRAAGFMVRIL